MKKLLLLFAFFGAVGLVSVNAQDCPYAKKATAEKSAACCSKTAAAKAAALDASIVQQVNEKSGDVTYMRKNVCEVSGKTSFQEVKYCTESKAFINVSPSEKAAAEKASLSGKKTSCHGAAKSATATKVGNAKKKGCCASKAKASCGSKASTEKAAVSKKAKLVKSEEGA